MIAECDIFLIERIPRPVHKPPDKSNGPARDGFILFQEPAQNKGAIKSIISAEVCSLNFGHLSLSLIRGTAIEMATGAEQTQLVTTLIATESRVTTITVASAFVATTSIASVSTAASVDIAVGPALAAMAIVATAMSISMVIAMAISMTIVMASKHKHRCVGPSVVGDLHQQAKNKYILTKYHCCQLASTKIFWGTYSYMCTLSLYVYCCTNVLSLTYAISGI